MRPTEEITGDIGETKTKLETLDQSLQKKQQQLGKLKESHVKLVESRLGRERLPKSIGKQRESMLGIGLEIENLEVIKDNLQERLAHLQTELSRAELYENTLQAYRQAEQLFAEKAEMVIQEIIDLNRRLQSARESVEAFLQGSENPLEILKSLLSDPALSGLSLRDFFLGHSVKGRPEENAAFVQELVQVYRELARKLPMLTEVKDSWVALSNHFDFIARTASDLTPRKVKYTTEPSPAPAQKHSQTIQTNPRNLALVDAHKQREVEAIQRRAKGIKVVNANKIIRAAQHSL